MKPARRDALRRLSGLVLLPALAACGPPPALRIASHVWPGYEFMFLARAEGWLDARRVSLLETASATESMQALAEGSADGAALTLDEVLRLRAGGVPLAVVLVFDISAGADMLLAGPGIERLAGLKGRRIGVEEGAVGALMLDQALRAAGLAPGEVRTVFVPIDRHEEAWHAGGLDALVTYEPVAGRLMDAGARRIFDSRSLPDTIVDVLAIRTPVLDGGADEAVRHLVAAHLRGLDHLASHPQDAAYRLAPRLKLPPGETLAAFRGLLLPDRDGNRRLLAGAAPALLASARRLSSVMAAAGLQPTEDGPAGLLRPEFLPGAAQ
ncbi:MAG: ABC transporter substrate-binding protein [Rhodocyclaceae bacterium]